MKKKQLFSAALAALMLCSTGLVACGGSNAAEDVSPVEFMSSAYRNTGAKKQTAVNDRTDNAVHNTISGSTLTVDALSEDDRQISDTLFGLFLEDINYAVDGGLYTEMIKNGSFEYDDLGRAYNMNGWERIGKPEASLVDGSQAGTALGSQNPHFLRLSLSENGTGIRNSGHITGLAVKKNAKYTASFYLHAPSSYQGTVSVAVKKGETVLLSGEVKVDVNKKAWTKYSIDLTGLDTAAEDVVFELTFTKGTLDIDSISLKPEEHFGSADIRKDLGEALAALNPSFLRFPGGCVIEGKGLKTAYDWKASVGEGETMTYIDGATGKTVTETGSTANRALGTDIWANLAAEVTNPYYTSYGIGFYEYFLLCEDLDAAPVPILNCGMSCQIQGGFESVPITNKKFQQYIDDALDLVEFCRGDASTEWGAIRIAMGHAEPFELTYLGIGNEQWGADYFEHFEAFRKAFETAAAEDPLYKDVELIVANGPNSGDTYAWNRIKNSGLGADYAGLVDEHYYCTPDWFYANNARYDSYDRNNVPVFLGEYAAKSNTLNAALAEASYATALERNGDIVKLAAYAPLFGNTTANQWTPDMIFYSNDGYYLTPNYYVQQMIANNKGTVLPGSALSVADAEVENLTGAVGIGTWATSATFDDILVVKNGSGDILFSDSEFANASLYTDHCGKWTLEGGVATQSSVSTPSKQTGDVLYFGDSTWSNYTFTVKATKTGGVEGFIIPFCVGDPDNFYHWNIGGWSNTVSCLESATGGVKHGQVAGTVKDIFVETGHEYEIKIVVDGNNVKCYLDGTLYVDYTVASAQGLYQVTSYDEATGDLIIKIVNPGVDNYALDISLLGYDVESVADVTVLQSNSLTAANTYSDPDFIKPVTGTLNVSNSFTYEVPFYSFSVIRIHTK